MYVILLFSTIVLGRYFAWNPANIEILPGDTVTVSFYYKLKILTCTGESNVSDHIASKWTSVDLV